MERSPAESKTNEIGMYDSLFNATLNTALDSREWTAVRVEASGTTFSLVPVGVEGEQLIPLREDDVHSFVAELKQGLPQQDWSEAFQIENTQDGLRVIIDYSLVRKI